MALRDRSELATAKRVVVKVGSSSISGENESKIDSLVDALAKSHSRGTEVILVTSGAIATALPLFNLDSRPDDLATVQALASVGQSKLIARYQDSLDKHKIIAGQVLLTAGDFEVTETRANAKATLDRLVKLRAMPIVNENDTVATHEIKFGDNDRLAALVAVLVDADALHHVVNVIRKVRDCRGRVARIPPRRDVLLLRQIFVALVVGKRFDGPLHRHA